MSRTSNMVWSLIGLVVLILGILGAIYGPEMYREGRAIVGPIVDIAQSEQRLSSLNAELPFEEPADGVLDESRFSVFLAIRRDLQPRYLKWQSIERQLEQHNQEDWGSAKELLGAIQDVMTFQIQTLQTHGMSPAEFVWIEDLAYVTWTTRVEDVIETSAVNEKMRDTTAADIEALSKLETQFGSSKATIAFAARLNQRLQSIDNPDEPAIEGVADETSSLLWTHRNELVELDFARYSELHHALRGTNSVSINIDGDEEGSTHPDAG